MKRYILAGLTGMLLASGANATVSLTGVTVNGVNSAGVPTGTVWDTINNSYYTVFVQPGFGGGVVVNPTPASQSISVPIALGENDFTIAGQSFAIEGAYKITLGFSNGATVSEIYTRSSDTDSAATVATVDGIKYMLDGFAWNNSHVNSVSAFNNTPDARGARSDFGGSFSLITAAVPEPASWAMMLAGFGMVGFAARRRSKPSFKVTYA